MHVAQVQGDTEPGRRQFRNGQARPVSDRVHQRRDQRVRFDACAVDHHADVGEDAVEALREQFEANLFGWHDLTRRIVPVMRKQGHGRIVHCSSILGLTPALWRGAYVASKHAVEGLMLTLRMELAGSGIHVSLIEPGPVESKIASNGLPYFERFIDHENSVHRVDYQAQLARLRSGG